MKIPLSWLREYVAVPPAVPALVERLTLAGLEVAGVRFVGVAAPDGLPPQMCETGPVWAPGRASAAPASARTSRLDVTLLELGKVVMARPQMCSRFDFQVTPTPLFLVWRQQ